MNTKDDALKLALEALEFNCVSSEDGEDLTPAKIKKAIAAIREALAEDSSGTEQPAQQTAPCGWRMKHNGEWAYSFTEDAWDFIYAVSPAARKAARDNAPASKPWVGLVWGELPEDGHNHDFLRGAAWAESKLREKNA